MPALRDVTHLRLDVHHPLLVLLGPRGQPPLQGEPELHEPPEEQRQGQHHQHHDDAPVLLQPPHQGPHR